MKIRNKLLKTKGAVLVLFVAVLPLIFSLFAISLDVGYLYATEYQLKAIADSSALAAASGMYLGETEVRNRATTYAAKNKINNKPIVLEPEDIVLGVWDPATLVFTPVGTSDVKPNAVKVIPQLTSARGTGVNLLLAKMMGIASSDVKASAIAVYGPRDIMMSLDYSGSMNSDSTLDAGAIAKLGRSAVEQNVLNIWKDLGSPVYGNLVSTTPGTQLTGNSNSILKTLKLNTVTYPYSSGGSWADYVTYVKAITDNNYKNRYGYLTLMDYWQSKYPAYSQINTLWKTREQPIQSVKDAVAVFIQYLQQNPTDDHLGLDIFTFTDNTAKLEVALTSNFTQVQTIANQRQAGHYIPATNIAAGIKTAIAELQTNGRVGALQIIVLLSDGQPNWTSTGSTSVSKAKTEALAQAAAAAAKKIYILTISLGSGADTALMQQIADATKGVHYIVPGGTSVNSIRDQLNDVFTQIAAYRPLKLVQ